MVDRELDNCTIDSVFQASLRRVIIVQGSLETLFNLICRSSEAGLSQRRLIWLLIVSDVTLSSHLKAECSIPWNDILVFNTVNPVFDSKVSLFEDYSSFTLPRQIGIPILIPILFPYLESEYISEQCGISSSYKCSHREPPPNPSPSSAM